MSITLLPFCTISRNASINISSDKGHSTSISEIDTFHSRNITFFPTRLSKTMCFFEWQDWRFHFLFTMSRRIACMSELIFLQRNILFFYVSFLNIFLHEAIFDFPYFFKNTLLHQFIIFSMRRLAAYTRSEISTVTGVTLTKKDRLFTSVFNDLDLLYLPTWYWPDYAEDLEPWRNLSCLHIR